MDILQVLAHEKNVAVIVTLHELELAQKLADAVVCVAPSGVSAAGTAGRLAQDNICALFGLSTDQYAVLFAGAAQSRSPNLSTISAAGSVCCAAATPPAPVRRWGGGGGAAAADRPRAGKRYLRTPKGIGGCTGSSAA